MQVRGMPPALLEAMLVSPGRTAATSAGRRRRSCDFDPVKHRVETPRFHQGFQRHSSPGVQSGPQQTGSMWQISAGPGPEFELDLFHLLTPMTLWITARRNYGEVYLRPGRTLYPNIHTKKHGGSVAGRQATGRPAPRTAAGGGDQGVTGRKRPS